MVSNDNLMLEGMKILIDGYDHKGEKVSVSMRFLTH